MLRLSNLSELDRAPMSEVMIYRNL